MRDKPPDVDEAVWSRVPLDDAFEAVVEMDAGGRVQNFNRAACELFGYAREQAVGRPLAELVIPERSRADHWAGLLRLAQGEPSTLLGRPRRVDACRADGGEFPIELMVVCAPGEPVVFTGFIRDLSDLERRDSQERLRAAISSTLLEWEREDETIPELLGRLGSAMDWAVGCLWARTQTSALGCRALWTAPAVPAAELERATRESRRAPAAGFAGKVWSDGTPRTSDSIDDVVDGKRRRVLEELGVSAGLAFPVVVHGELAAVCECFFRGPCPFDDAELHVLEAIGAEVGHFLLRHRAELEPARLSPRECEVLQLSAEGKAVTEIALALQISPMTVKSHLRHIYVKLEVPGRTAAVAEALRVGLIR